jgi:beta-ketoacyl-acyl-carrier-protein synthase II
MAERVVVTGMDAITPLGHSFKETWENLVNGVSGVGPITHFNTSNYLVQIACEVKDFNPELFMPAKEARRRDRFEQFAAVAVQGALLQAGLDGGSSRLDRIGVIFSSAIGGLNTLVETFAIVEKEQPRKVSPFAIPMLMSNGSAGMISIDYGFQGPSFSIASACASGADAIGIAWMLIRTGVIDAAITGASEATVTPTGIATFDRLGALSRRNENYSMTPQPFDKNRDGLVMGEGGAALVLEAESHAHARGAEILAELAGYAATADAYHITAPSEDGAGGSRAIRQALASAQINPQQVGYINAHGTATELNDRSETLAIKAAFGDSAYNIPVSSTKSMTGHMMGATGALEAAVCVQAVREGVLPPTIHYETPDPECDLDYVPNQARQVKIETALSNAFGFGGHNAVLVIKKYR